MTVCVSYINSPVYYVNSSDIVDNKIEEATYIGARVFVKDTSLWYIINNDLTLSFYSEPITAGDINIGDVQGLGIPGTPLGGLMTVQGDNLGIPLRIIPSNDYGFLMASGKHVFVNSDEMHFHVHSGDLYSASYFQTSISSNGTVNVGVTTGNKKVHIGLTHQASGEGRIDFYYNGVVFSGGTNVNILNHDISITDLPEVTFNASPTITGAGSVVRSILIIGGTGGQRTGGVSPFSREFIIPSNSQLYFKFTNLDGNNCNYNFVADFYEVPS